MLLDTLSVFWIEIYLCGNKDSCLTNFLILDGACCGCLVNRRKKLKHVAIVQEKLVFITIYLATQTLHLFVYSISKIECMFNKILNIVWSQIEQTGMRNDESHCWIHTRFLNGFFLFCSFIYIFLCYFGKSFFSFFLLLSKLFSQRHDFRKDKKKKKVTQMKLFSNFTAPSSQPHGFFFLLFSILFACVVAVYQFNKTKSKLKAEKHFI